VSLNLNWNASFSTTVTKFEEGGSLPIEGELLDTSVNKNKWQVLAEEMPSIARQVKRGVQLRVDHSNSVRDIIGATNKGEFDSKNNKVLFGAEVDDPVIARGIIKGRLGYVSIGAQADAHCSACDVKYKGYKECNCKAGHTIIKNVKLREVSIVSNPAYVNSKFNPISFVASVDKALAEIEVKNEKEEKYMVEEKTESFSAEEVKQIARDVLTNEMTKMATDMFGPMKQEVSDISKSLKVILTERTEELSKKEIEKKEEAAKAKEAELVKTILKTVMEEIAKTEKVVKELTPEEKQKLKDEEDAKKKKEEETIVKGAMVENAEGEVKTEVTGLDSVWAEIRVAAEKFEII